MRKLVCAIGRILLLFKNKELPSYPNKILFVRSGAIGDVIMTTPLVRAIRKSYPGAKITYLVGEWSKDVLKNNKNIDNIVSFKDEIITKRNPVGVFKLIQTIRKEKFDLAFVLDKSYLWGLVVLLSGIRTRIGFNRTGEGFPNNLNIKYDGTKHEIAYNMCLGLYCGATLNDTTTELHISEEDKQIAIKHLTGKPFVGIAPGGAKNPGQEMAKKRWPVDKYAKLIHELIKGGNNVALIGGKGDVEIAKEIHDKLTETDRKHLTNVTGKLTIQQSTALMKRCDIMITTDSGPLHMAATTNVPLIALFGPTDPNRFAPSHAHVITTKILCVPCYTAQGTHASCNNRICMNLIEVKDVLKKINEINKNGRL